MDIRAGCPCRDAYFFHDLEGLTEVFRRMSAGTSGPKRLLLLLLLGDCVRQLCQNIEAGKCILMDLLCPSFVRVRMNLWSQKLLCSLGSEHSTQIFDPWPPDWETAPSPEGSLTKNIYVYVPLQFSFLIHVVNFKCSPRVGT